MHSTGDAEEGIRDLLCSMHSVRITGPVDWPNGPVSVELVGEVVGPHAVDE